MSGIALQELFVSLGVNVDRAQFDAADRVMARLEGSFDGIKEAFQKIPQVVKDVALGSLLADAVKEGVQVVRTAVSEIPRQIQDAIVGTAEAGNEINKLAAATGVSAQALQEFKFVAAQTEVPFDSIRMGFFHIQRTAYEAAREVGGSAAQAFARLHVQLRDTAGHLRPAEELFVDTAVALGQLDDQSTANALSFQLFGRGTAELAPLLRETRASLVQMRAEAHAFGAVMDSELIAKGVAWDNAVDRMEASFTGLRYAIGGPLIHYLTEAAGAVSDWVVANRDWIATGIGAFVDGLADTVKAFLPEGTTLTSVLLLLAYSVRLIGAGLSIMSGPLGVVVSLLKVAAVFAALYAVGLVSAAAAELLVAGAGITLDAVLWRIIIALGYIDTELIVATGGFVLLGAAVTSVFAALALLADDLYVYSKGGKSLFGDFVNYMAQIRAQLEMGSGEVPWFLDVLYRGYRVAKGIKDLLGDLFTGRLDAAWAHFKGFGLAVNTGFSNWNWMNEADAMEPASRFGGGASPGAAVSLAYQGPYANPYAAPLNGGGVTVHAPTTIVVQGATDAQSVAAEVNRQLDLRDEKVLRAAAAVLVNPAVEHP